MNRDATIDSPIARIATTALWLAVALLGTSPAFVSAQVDSAASPPSSLARPRIGVALGGGSARGFAHIGVLKWFDEHRIPIDAIAGTSMGGLIGGAFATGMSHTEIEHLVSTITWERFLAPGASFPDKEFRRKQDARAFPSRLEFGLRDGFSLPAGLSAGQQVELMLGRIAMPYYSVTNFDQFPTPFRCVAADLRKAETVVFSSGWLARALRATMAIPGVFAPVVDEGRTLVDGGILNNVPADVVAAMGADIVIAVDVSNDLTYEKRGDSLLAVAAESLDAMMRASTRRALDKANVVLIPDLRGFFGTEFDRIGDFVRLGYAAAEAQRTAFEKYALSPADYQAYLADRARRRQTRLPSPMFVEVEGVPPVEAAALRRRLDRFVLAPLDTDGLDRQMLAMMGTERYLSVTYRVVADGPRIGIVVTARPKTYGPPFMLLALDLQNNASTGVEATVRGRAWTSGVTGQGSEIRLDVAAGTNLGATAEWYQPMGRSNLFVAPYAGVAARQFNVFEDGRYHAEYRENVSRVGVDAGLEMGTAIEWRAGYTFEHLDRHPLVGDAVLPTTDGGQRYFTLQATYDGQSEPTIPERGLFARARLRRFTHTASAVGTGMTGVSHVEPNALLSGEIDSSVYAPVSRMGRVFVRAAGGSSFGSTALVNAFTLGGPFSLGALNIGELRGSNYLLAAAGYFHEVYRFAQGAAGRVYAGGWLETGSVFERFSGAAFKTNLSSGFVIDTPIGPISAGASIGVDGRYRFYAGLGPLLHR